MFSYVTENNTVVYSTDGLKYAKENAHKAFPKICTAVVVKSLPQRLLANFYTRLLNRGVPHKTFNHYNEAEEWCLIQYKEFQSNKRNPNLYSSVM